MGHVVDRVHKQYPYISKTQTTIIIKELFNKIREELIAGNSITFAGFINNLTLIEFQRREKHVIQAKLSTPPNFRKLQTRRKISR